MMPNNNAKKIIFSSLSECKQTIQKIVVTGILQYGKFFGVENERKEELEEIKSRTPH